LSAVVDGSTLRSIVRRKWATAICLLGLTLPLTACAPLDRYVARALGSPGDWLSEYPPPILEGTARDGNVRLSWTLDPAAYPSLPQVIMYRSTRRRGAAQGDPYAEIGRVNAPSSSYIDRNVRNGTTYYYRAVVSGLLFGDTRPSNVVSATPGGGGPCSPPNCPWVRIAAGSEQPSVLSANASFRARFSTSSIFHGRRSVLGRKLRERGAEADGRFSAKLKLPGKSAASLRVFSKGIWRMSLDYLFDPTARNGTATWLALATFDDSRGGELCLRFKSTYLLSGSGTRGTIDQHVRFETMGGTGGAGRLRVSGSSQRHSTVSAATAFAPPAAFTVRGTGRATSEARKALSPGCIRLRAG
jgi:hypothetical protein